MVKNKNKNKMVRGQLERQKARWLARRVATYEKPGTLVFAPDGLGTSCWLEGSSTITPKPSDRDEIFEVIATYKV